MNWASGMRGNDRLGSSAGAELPDSHTSLRFRRLFFCSIYFRSLAKAGVNLEVDVSFAHEFRSWLYCAVFSRGGG